jgi:hypothetical protein
LALANERTGKIFLPSPPPVEGEASDSLADPDLVPSSHIKVVRLGVPFLLRFVNAASLVARLVFVHRVFDLATCQNKLYFRGHVGLDRTNYITSFFGRPSFGFLGFGIAH